MSGFLQDFGKTSPKSPPQTSQHSALKIFHLENLGTQKMDSYIFIEHKFIPAPRLWQKNSPPEPISDKLTTCYGPAIGLDLSLAFVVVLEIVSLGRRRHCFKGGGGYCSRQRGVAGGRASGYWLFWESRLSGEL